MSLSILIIIPFLTALAVIFCRNAEQVKWSSLIGSVAQLAISGVMFFQYNALRKAGEVAQFVFEEKHTWFSSMNINYHIGVDGIAIAMILLTAFVVVAGVLVSWNVSYLTKEFYLLLVLLSTGAYGFFISLDLFTMFFFLELAVIPKFLLIGIWGSGRKEYSAMKLALMLMGGSALVLMGLLIVYFGSATSCGAPTYNLVEIAAHRLDFSTQMFAFPFLFAGFGVFTAMFPFHTWAPDGHSSAPTAASMFLAGISMKLGGYGCLRVAVYLLPDAAHEYSWIVVLLAAIAIFYGSFATMMQKDLKYINAYSSVSHCGFVLLGIGMLNKTAITGAVMQMVSHGLMTALFFAAIGMIYERTHTRQVEKLGGLLKVIPFLSTIFVIAGLCSLGLPGLSGFVAEMTVFQGAWQRPETFYRLATVLGCLSIVVTAVYILRASGKVIMGPIVDEHHTHLSDARWNEKLASVILLVAILAIGTAPFWLTDLLNPGSELIMNQLTAR
jgi:NADH-quinone oxidoreductase subunit M